MDERGQTERGKEQVLAPFMVDIGTVDMTANVAGNSVFWPAPFLHGSRIELQFTRKGREALVSLAINHHADRGTVTRNLACLLIGLRALQFGWFQLAFIQSEDGHFVLGNFKGAIFTHVFQRRKIFLCSRLRQSRHAILEYPAVVFLDRKLLAGPVGGLEVLANAETAIRVDAP